MTFVAFQAAIELLRERGREDRLTEIYRACLEELKKPLAEQRNVVQDIYAPFSPEEISARIAQILYPRVSD
ncbi:MAG: hypothetical protein ACLFTV_17350, partial [Desulfococcaceae bacterium]